MRVLFWQELFWPYMGGAEVMASKLVLALRERGHDIIVVTRRDQPDLPALEQFCGINVYRFPFWTVLNNGGMKGLLELRQQIIRIKREFRPDLVHMNCFGPSWLFYQDTARHDAAPLLVTLHTMPQHTMVKRALEPDGLLRRTLNTADWVTCVSAAVLDHTRARVAEITGRSSVVYNGLEDPGVFPAPLPLDPPRILCVGRLVREKGFDLALSAFALLLKAFPKARLIIAGDGTSRHELECQAGDLGLTHAVEFIGWVAPNRIPKLMNDSTIVVMPSRSEALPTVALEAGLMGRPVVAARVGGVAEIVVDRQTGLLTDPEDFQALASAMAFLLRQPSNAVEAGRAARRRIQTLFSFDQYVDRYETLYREITAASGATTSIDDTGR